MSLESRVCIIGPSVDTDYIGGVATHVKNLKSLSCFRNVVIIDPGSVNSNSRTAISQIIKNIASLRKKIWIGTFSHVLINTSIYPSAFIKLLVILVFLPTRKQREIHVFFHGGRFPSLNSIFSVMIKLILRPIMTKVEKFHFLSRVQLEGFSRIFPNSDAELYENYATEDTILDKNREPDAAILKLLFVGRVVRDKGVFEMLSAIEKISTEVGNVSLTIAGDGPDMAELIKQSEKLPLGTVHVMGYLTGVALEDAYRKADVLLLPSYHEGFPYVAIEAMRAGMPIISTSSGALETLVKDGVTGFKVHPKDVDSIVSAVNRLLDNRALLDEMSKNCHSYFQKNLSRSAAEKYYSQLLDRQVANNSWV